MGNGSYNISSRSARATMDGYHTKAVEEVFKQRSIHETLNPFGLKFRECRDNADHPNAFPVIIALDVTGSMGRIPHDLIKNGLPTMMSTLIEAHMNDAAICFMAVGDHKCDKAPIQVAQFEASDLALDTHLTNTWLEGNGGGNNGESYFIPWFVAAKHTVTDAWEKRKQKGIIFTIGDEHCHTGMDSYSTKSIFGGEGSDVLRDSILKEAQERYHVYHLNLGGPEEQHSWNQILGENNVKVKDFTDIPKIISELTLRVYNTSVVGKEKVKEQNGSTEQTTAPTITL